MTKNYETVVLFLATILEIVSPRATRTQAILSPRNSKSLGTRVEVFSPFSVLESIFCKIVSFCLQLLEFITLPTTSKWNSVTAGNLGNTFTWKFGSPVLKIFNRESVSPILHKVSVKVFFSWRLEGGSQSFFNFSSSNSNVSRTSRIVFLTGWACSS